LPPLDAVSRRRKLHRTHHGDNYCEEVVVGASGGHINPFPINLWDLNLKGRKDPMGKLETNNNYQAVLLEILSVFLCDKFCKLGNRWMLENEKQS
jgi:hypothetical protein